MPNCNPGYDFICDNNYKIDAKASCRHIRFSRNDSWLFNINKNQVADYFACLAINNCDDLNIEHFWLIPGNIINYKITFTICESKLNNWIKYEQDINRVIKCHNVLNEDDL